MVITSLYLLLILLVVIVFRLDMSVLFLVMIMTLGNGLRGFIFMELMFIVVLFGV